MKIYQTKVKCNPLHSFIWVTLLLVQESVQIIFKPTPCPTTFNYEQGEPGDDRWYGDITLRINKTVDTSTFRITLDRPSQLLVSWAGPAFTADNKLYIASLEDAVLDKGSVYKVKFMVKFDNSQEVPMLETIHFNSLRICPPDSVALSSPGDTYIYGSRPSRPDIEVTETTDVISEFERRTSTARPSVRPSISGVANNINGDVWNNVQNTPRVTNRPPNIQGANQQSNFNQGSISNTQNAANFNQNNGGSNFGSGGKNGNPTNTASSSAEIACGTVSVANPLITKGQKSHQGQWPWHVALYKTEGINLTYLCGGLLISKNKILTAAHCLVTTPGNKVISPKSLIVYLGKFNLRQYTGETGVQTKEVSRLNVNPKYNSTNFHGDIAILTLSSDVEYTNYVRPVCLWEASNSIADVEGNEGVVAGWGLTEYEQTSEELKFATLPVVSTETCLRSYPKFYSEYMSENSFCAGFRNGTSPCNGDSGGGLVFKRSDAWYLRGIVSLSVAKEGLNFCDPNYYVLFTDVAKYSDFIKKNYS